MPLIRGHHAFDDHFTQIPNEWLRDTRLSFKARGLLALVMSHISGWSLSIASLADHNQEGRDAIRTAISELEKYGYLTRSQVNQDGKFGEAIWVTHDPTDYPSSENPSSENPTPKKNIIKEEQVKKNINALFEEFWNAYPRKLDKAKAFRSFKSALSRTTFEDVMAGVIAYRNDPARNPDFTKYPATWLNADSWENAANPSPQSEAAERANLRREKELAASREYLEQQRQQAEKVTGPVYCKHGKNLALCAPCSKSLS
jgi:hypothetical protein